jgi:glycosyltransferase involved in cell wall biosynthesis
MQGRLVIAADVGGLGETVNGFGLKFPPGDITALKVCMQKTVENPGASIQMRMKARINAAREFSEERMVKEHLQLYCRLMRIQTRPRKQNAGI